MNKPLRRAAVLIAIWLTAISASASAQSTRKSATQPTFLAPHAINLHELLTDPPADGSTEQKTEMQTLLTWQEKRTPADVTRCESEVASTAFTFSEVIGSWFTADNLPATAALFNEIGSEMRIPVGAAKADWNRVRPFKTNKDLDPCVVVETTPSYPSGHATRGIVWGTILSEIFPGQRERLMTVGKRIGDDRVIAGMHYPSDVAAGQKLGAEIARLMLASPQLAVALDEAKAECQKVAQANAAK